MIGELPIPRRAAAAAGATAELLRAWLVDDRIECSLAAGEENDLPSAWGEILAGVAIAVAEQISETTQPTVDHRVLSTIREHLELGTSVPDAADPMRHLRDLERFVAEFNEETDRAAAVLGGAAIDAYLKESLRDFLVDDKSVDELFGKYGPLASFAARIDIAFAVGIISDGLRRQLHIIRRIRNEFAHNPEKTSFSSSPVRDHCERLVARYSVDEDGNDRVPSPPRTAYLHAIGMSMAYINVSMRRQRRRTTPGAYAPGSLQGEW